MRSRSTPVTALVACGVLVGLGACTSQPSIRAVTRDMIESLEDVDETAKTCMLAELEGYSTDQLEAIGADNLDFTSLDPATLDSATPDLQAFVEDLRTCLQRG